MPGWQISEWNLFFFLESQQKCKIYSTDFQLLNLSFDLQKLRERERDFCSFQSLWRFLLLPARNRIEAASFVVFEGKGQFRFSFLCRQLFSHVVQLGFCSGCSAWRPKSLCTFLPAQPTLLPKNYIKIIKLTNPKFWFNRVDCKETFQFYLQKNLIRGVLMTGPSLNKYLTPSASSLGAKVWFSSAAL